MRFAKFKLLFVLLASAAALLLVRGARSAPVFEPGIAYELYTGSSSEEIVRTGSPFLIKLLRTDIRGESTRYAGDRAEELIASFDASVCFVEEAAGVTNYYCYTPRLGHGIALFGHTVNLHIAVGDGYTAAGTPIVFGGY